MWERFAAARDAADWPHELDAWTRRVLEPLAGDLGAGVVYPFGGPPFHPFQRWAMKAEGLRPSPIGVLMHPEHGPWHAYRPPSCSPSTWTCRHSRNTRILASPARGSLASAVVRSAPSAKPVTIGRAARRMSPPPALLAARPVARHAMPARWASHTCPNRPRFTWRRSCAHEAWRSQVQAGPITGTSSVSRTQPGRRHVIPHAAPVSRSVRHPSSCRTAVPPRSAWQDRWCPWPSARR